MKRCDWIRGNLFSRELGVKVDSAAFEMDLFCAAATVEAETPRERLDAENSTPSFEAGQIGHHLWR